MRSRAGSEHPALIMSSAAEAPVDPRQRLLETTIDGWIAHDAESRPSHLAFVCDDRRVTWADFDAR